MCLGALFKPLSNPFICHFPIGIAKYLVLHQPQFILPDISELLEKPEMPGSSQDKYIRPISEI